MKKSILTFVLLMSVSLAFAQKMFQSTDEVSAETYIPTVEFKARVAKLSKNEYQVDDNNFTQLQNGCIAWYQNNETYHEIRMIFDKNQNWLETQNTHHSDLSKDDDFHKLFPKMAKKAKKQKYDARYFEKYIKITNEKGFWYELKTIKEGDIQIFVFDKDLKFVKNEKKYLRYEVGGTN